MKNILIIAPKNEAVELCSSLTEHGFTCRSAPDISEALERVAEQAPDLLLSDFDSKSGAQELSDQIKMKKLPPIIALIQRDYLPDINGHLDAVADFVVKPYSSQELVLRIRRLLHEPDETAGDELITCGDLVIDLAKCEVTVNGEPVELTFREYELLKFLVKNKGRVHTREALLNKVWGYDYYGGDRTVDVHIRRLRSKIEGSSHCLIETVRNIGYRFKQKIEK